MAHTEPLVSVIVPTRNSSRTLDACLESIRAQQYRPIELIVVDNESTDKTNVIAKRYCDIVESFGPERSAQRNRGVQVAHGDYFLFIDSDMSLAPTVVSDCISVIRLSGAPAAVIPEVSVGEGFLANCRALERSCYVGDDTIEAARFFTRTAFDSVSGFDENLTGPEDWDLSSRVAAGRALPRTASYISHDEGRLQIRTVFAKKRYYAASSLRYVRKHGASSIGRGNMVFRPAFARNWRRFARHPFLGVGVFVLKSVEAAAVIWGASAEWVRTRTDRHTKPEST